MSSPSGRPPLRPGGMFEEDDGENWEQSTAATDGEIGLTLPFNIQMGLGREQVVQRPGLPDMIEGATNEYGRRSFLDAWFSHMLTD